MANILRFSKKQLDKTLKNFAKKESLGSDDISEWIRLINDFIYEFDLKSEVNEEGILSITTTKEEQVVIERMMYVLEGSKTSFNYIFVGDDHRLDSKLCDWWSNKFFAQQCSSNSSGPICDVCFIRGSFLPNRQSHHSEKNS